MVAVENGPAQAGRVTSSPLTIHNVNSTIMITGLVPYKIEEAMLRIDINALVDPLIETFATTNGNLTRKFLDGTAQQQWQQIAKSSSDMKKPPTSFSVSGMRRRRMSLKVRRLQLRAQFDESTDDRRKGIIISMLRQKIEEKCPHVKVGQNKHFGEVVASTAGKRPSQIFKVSSNGCEVESKVAALTRLDIDLETAESIRASVLENAQ